MRVKQLEKNQEPVKDSKKQKVLSKLSQLKTAIKTTPSNVENWVFNHWVTYAIVKGLLFSLWLPTPVLLGFLFNYTLDFTKPNDSFRCIVLFYTRIFLLGQAKGQDC